MRPLVPMLLAMGCNTVLGTPEVHRGACAADAPFQDTAPVGGIDSGLGVQGAQLSPDELTVVFSRQTMLAGPAGPISRHGDLYLARRDHRGDAFRAAVALDELNTTSDERSASLADDQQTLYFDRRDPAELYHLFVATRPAPAEPFGAAVPVNLGDPAGSTLEPFLTSSALYFVSARSDGTASLFAAERRDGAFLAPVRLTALEILPSPAAYASPVVSADGLTIYYSAPPDNSTPDDIWAASRADRDHPFGAPHTVAELDTVSIERPSWLSPDHCRLYFVTNRAGQGLQLWVASRAAR